MFLNVTKTKKLSLESPNEFVDDKSSASEDISVGDVSSDGGDYADFPIVINNQSTPQGLEEYKDEEQGNETVTKERSQSFDQKTIPSYQERSIKNEIETPKKGRAILKNTFDKESSRA